LLTGCGITLHGVLALDELLLIKNHKSYWLSVNRLLDHKRVDLQIKAFAKLTNEKLVIVGSYEKGAVQFEKYQKYIESIKPKNVEIINWVDDKNLKELYSECKGFITTARDEDFGMTVVEAMASGKPVIAPNEGGYRETVINEVTGILINNLEINTIIDSIKKINENMENYKDECIKQAQKFDTKVFVEKIKYEMSKQIFIFNIRQ
jgi:glycosyltransferase involved in cell wall biosynthesis